MRYKGQSRIFSEEDFNNEVKDINTGVGKANKHRSFVYYTDIRDPTSHVFVVKFIPQ